ncbi:Shwachman-Bodian-Diamond syndrome like protein [Giardia muris]|uniref:Shwachman-Bodian-Diamond syndrome like protein n=1 Tax=Giardia muris TaxID=5742 RepID=A0A4Z1T1K9_GIAMU|nr:Shwachman-Bodian-Diamond syndrome like protein [Giardia muris]|eukprot:TNJ26827.1 Shwachman-Bodian-Diamond syndrome like protein [Giardia muris]
MATGGQRQRLTQPVTQKLYTNVSIAHLTRNGLKFEVACYHNKALLYRNNLEGSIDDVLQSRLVFADAARGIIHSSEALEKAFGTSNYADVCDRIVRTGRLQSSLIERSTESERLVAQLVTLIRARTTNGATGGPFPTPVLEEAIRLLHYRPNTQPPSAQAAHVIKRLKAKYHDLIIPKPLDVCLSLPLSVAKDSLLRCTRECGLLLDHTTAAFEQGACFINGSVHPESYALLKRILQEIHPLASATLHTTTKLKVK